MLDVDAAMVLCTEVNKKSKLLNWFILFTYEIALKHPLSGHCKIKPDRTYEIDALLYSTKHI